ncbi:MAG: response regulator [Candidatus Eisenbacteria bacterium]
MSHAIGAPWSPFDPPLDRPVTILVVDDDARVIELLEIAFGAHGWRVVRATDGEQALRLVTSERPDLVVLDVRLPRRSGFDVCEALRRDPTTSDLPVIMVSAVAETDARVQGLARGADDYLAKPFSPKELVARIRRMLARSREAREARRLGIEAEIELTRAREETQRHQQELRHARHVRDLAAATARELSRHGDRDEMLGAFLATLDTHLRTGLAVVLAPGPDPRRLEPAASRGAGSERLRGLTLARDGELARLADGLGRVVRVAELERLSELRAELPALAASGCSLLAPARGPEGLEALLAFDDKRDGSDLTRPESERLLALLGVLATALDRQRRLDAQAEAIETLLVRLADQADPAGAVARAEAAAWIADVAPGQFDSWRVATRVSAAIRLGAWAAEAGRDAMADATSRDRTGRIARIGLLIRGGDEADPTAVALVRVGWSWAAARAAGRDTREALEHALEGAGLEDAPTAALRAAAPGPKERPV